MFIWNFWISNHYIQAKRANGFQFVTATFKISKLSICEVKKPYQQQKQLNRTFCVGPEVATVHSDCEW